MSERYLGRQSDHLPLPSDINEVDDNFKRAAKDLYAFWIGLLNEKHLSPEEIEKRGNEYFDRHFFKNGVETDEGFWLLGYDFRSYHRSPKTRATLIKELAYQDFSRDKDGKRNNPPSSWYTLVATRSSNKS